MNADSRGFAALAALAVALLVVAAAAFVLVPFHAGTSKAATHSAAGKAVTDNATSDFHGRVYLYADGPASGPIANGVADRLTAAGLTIQRIDSLEGAHDRPVLALRVRTADVAWNPVTPSAATTVRFTYVASGNGTLAGRALRNESLALNSNGDRYVVDGTVGVRHRGTGVYSLPGYRRLVYDRTAADVTAVVRSQTRD